MAFKASRLSLQDLWTVSSPWTARALAVRASRLRDKATPLL
jgi:hypothetical protein